MPIIFHLRCNRIAGRPPGAGRQRGFGPFLQHIEGSPQLVMSISGITKDSTGAALGGCTVKLYRTSDDVLLGTTVSDATTGEYKFNASHCCAQYLVAYKAGSPDVAGTTVNTLVGT